MSNKQYLDSKKFINERSINKYNTFSTEREWENIKNKFSDKNKNKIK